MALFPGSIMVLPVGKSLALDQHEPFYAVKNLFLEA